MTSLEESLQKLQLEIQPKLYQSAYHRSLIRFHTDQAAAFDDSIDILAKKIRSLEANQPKVVPPIVPTETPIITEEPPHEPEPQKAA